MDYDRVFTSKEYIEKLFSHLGIDINSNISLGIDRYIEISKIHKERNRKEIPIHIIKAVQERIDKEAAEAVCDITGIDILKGIRNLGG